MTVLLGPGWPGVLLHEAIGHGLEGDFNRKGTSAFSGRIGERVGAPGVTVVDDGSIHDRRGSLSIDDEGTPTGETVLIEDGILKGYMQDRLNARLMGMEPTGNGRRESYAHAPIPRMTNTFMRAGNDDPAELLGRVKNGIFAKSFGGGQVDIVSGKFVFSCTEAYKVENGKLGAPIKGATLIGDGPSVLTRVSGIGNDLELDRGHRHVRQGRPERACRGWPADPADRCDHRGRHRLNLAPCQDAFRIIALSPPHKTERSMRKLIFAMAATTLALTGGAASAGQSTIEKGEARLAKMLDGRVPGEPVSCISTMGRDRLQVIDETAVVYDGGKTIYVARPSDRNQLESNDVLVIERTSGTQLCTMDVIRTIDRTSGFMTGAVFLDNSCPTPSRRVNRAWPPPRAAGRRNCCISGSTISARATGSVGGPAIDAALEQRFEPDLLACSRRAPTASCTIR